MISVSFAVYQLVHIMKKLNRIRNQNYQPTKNMLMKLKKPKDIVYPLDIQNYISKFQKLNTIKINVFQYQGDYSFDYARNK